MVPKPVNVYHSKVQMVLEKVQLCVPFTSFSTARLEILDEVPVLLREVFILSVYDSQISSGNIDREFFLSRRLF